MSQFRLNGSQPGGQLYPLDLKGQSLEAVAKEAKNDGLDQIFFEAEGQAYVLEGDGLDLSALKTQTFPQGELQVGDKVIPAHQILIDNETNTAREGLAKVGRVAWGLTLGSLGAGASLSLNGARTVQAGLNLSDAGLKTVQESTSLLGTQVKNAQYSVTLALGEQSFAKEVSKLPQNVLDKFFKGKRPNAAWPTELSQIQVPPKVVGELGSKEVLAAETGAGQVQQGVTQVLKGNQSLRMGLKVVAAGAAAVGVVAGAGLLYGALRGEEEHRLDAYKLAPDSNQNSNPVVGHPPGSANSTSLGPKLPSAD